jgi:acetyl-CoA acetyltransferase family protein
MSKLHILAGVRTPFVKAGGPAAKLSADDLGSIAVSELLARTGVEPSQIDEVIAGCVGQPSSAQNIARVIALRAGIPKQVPAVTVHRNCASGFEVLTTAAERMAAGRGSLFVVVGTESMSRYPIRYPDAMAPWLGRLVKARSLWARLKAFASLRWKHVKPFPTILEGLRDPVVKLSMGQTAEVLAREWGIDRDEQDAFALLSHQRAESAREVLGDEIVPLYPNGKAVRNDTGVRDGQTIEALAKLRPIFDRRAGSVTVGNACQVTDGAVALLVGDPARFGGEPLARLASYAYAGCDPARMGLGPAYAIPQAMGRRRLEGMEIVEINEAFAAQVIACTKALSSAEFAKTELGRTKAVGEIDAEKLNVHGGAIALGHPVGASGARLLLTIALEMQRRNLNSGLASLCVGGGQGGAIRLAR